MKIRNELENNNETKYYLINPLKDINKSPSPTVFFFFSLLFLHCRTHLGSLSDVLCRGHMHLIFLYILHYVKSNYRQLSLIKTVDTNWRMFTKGKNENRLADA